ncbi:FAD-binding domain-containing protein [Aspergillus aurantiobrunneus]
MFRPSPLLALFACLPAVLGSASHCTKLASFLPGRVFFPNNETYTSAQASYFALQEQQLTPTCIVIPSSAEHVATAVSRLAELPGSVFAIRSGGHSSVPGAANAHHGITIDLQQLNAVDLADGVVSIGPGALWTDVYDVLVPHGLAVVGGRTGIVGVGGLVTGGGLSAFSPHRGFACDNVVNMQVVLASGAIVDANATNHADLFAALKGGQNNFGVVTRFDMQTFPQGDFWGGAIQYPASADAAQLKAFHAFKASSSDPDAEVEVSFLFNGSDPDNPYSSNNMFYARPVVNASALRVFSDITPQLYSSMRVSNLSDFGNELSLFQPVDQFSIYATTTIRLSAAILRDIHALWQSFTTKQTIRQAPSLLSVLTFQALPPIIPSSPNVLGFAPTSHPETDLVLVLLSTYWSREDSEHSYVLHSGTRELLSALDELAESQALGHRFRYVNYAAEWQDPLASYGELSVREMRRVAAVYDPLGVFRWNVPGGFKVPVGIHD